MPGRTVKRLVNYMVWLRDRKVAVKSLYLRECTVKYLGKLTKFTLNSVVYVHTVLSASPNHRKFLPDVLLCCPNITCIERSQSHYNATSVLRILETVHVPKLERLLTNEHDLWLSGLVRNMLPTNGEHLLELRVGSIGHFGSLMKRILKYCPQLQVLSLVYLDEDVPTEVVVEFLQRSSHLKEIGLYDCTMSLHAHDDILAIVDAGKGHLQKFSLLFPRDAAIQLTLFSKLLHDDQCSWLEQLIIDEKLSYCSTTRALQLSFDAQQEEEVQQLLAACPMVSKLTLISCYHATQEIMHSMGEHVGTTLTELTMDKCMQSSACQLLQDCHQLVRLTVSVITAGDSNGDRDVCSALYCPSLQYLFLQYDAYSTIDDHLAAVFRQCPALEEVHLCRAGVITFPTLQAILDNKKLHKLTYKQMIGPDQPDLEKFQRLAKRKHLNPVPLIVKCRGK